MWPRGLARHWGWGYERGVARWFQSCSLEGCDWEAEDHAAGDLAQRGPWQTSAISKSYWGDSSKGPEEDIYNLSFQNSPRRRPTARALKGCCPLPFLPQPLAGGEPIVLTCGLEPSPVGLTSPSPSMSPSRTGLGGQHLQKVPPGPTQGHQPPPKHWASFVLAISTYMRPS